MKYRFLSILLALCLFLGMIPFASAGYSFDSSVNTDALVAGGIQMYSNNENTYDGVTPNDSGAVGMGILGWRGPKALELLKMICSKAPDMSKATLGATLYNEVLSARLSQWNYRVFSSAEVTAAKNLIRTTVGVAAQNELARNDILYQVNEAWKAGIRTDAAILYYCSVCNHYGPGGATTFMKYIRQVLGKTSGETINSLEEFHGAVVAAAKIYSFVSGPNGVYLAYRTRIYSFIKNTLKWDTTGATISAPDPVPSTQFSDLPPIGHWAYDAIVWAYTSNPQITTGTSSTTFSPYNTVTRAEAVTFLWRAAGCPAPTSSYNPFTDVKPGSYYYDAVLWAVEKGITHGTSATTFSPKRDVRREQILTFLWRYCGQPTVGKAVPFTDTPSGKYYYKAVVWAYWGGILLGNEGGGNAAVLRPAEDCSRAYVVTYLYNLFVMTAR